MAAHELLAHDEIEHAVAEELEALVGRLAAGRPGAVGEDLTPPPGREPREEPVETRCRGVADAQAVWAIT
jgi:hypothetical protein